MNAFLISLSTLFLLLAGSCSTTSPPTPPPVTKGVWSIDYKTSGGFVGVGHGSITVNSEGKFACSSNKGAEVVKGATGTLTPRQLQPLSDAVAKLDPKGWNIPGLKVAASDAFGYKLEFHGGPDGNELNAVQWYDNTADQLPADLKRLSTVLEQTMKSRCTAAP